MVKPKTQKKESKKEIVSKKDDSCCKDDCCNDSCCGIMPMKLGKALGLLLGTCLAFKAFFGLVLFPWGHAMIGLLGSVLPFYDSTPLGIFFGFVWGYLEGFVFGFLLGWLYNHVKNFPNCKC